MFRAALHMAGGVDNFFEVVGGGGGASCLELLLIPLGGSGGMPPQEIFWLFRALRLLLVQFSLVES